MTFKMALSMEMRFLLSSIAFISLHSCCLGLYEDAFHEELFIKPLPTGHIYTHFQFTTTWDVELKRKDECKTNRINLQGPGGVIFFRGTHKVRNNFRSIFR